MPFYRFDLEVSLSTQATMARIKTVVGPPRTVGAKFRRLFGPADDTSPPFIGEVEEGAFRVRRDIRYRNSFLPLVSGRVTGAPTGSRISVTMFLHPLVATFMLILCVGLGSVGVGLIEAPSESDRGAARLVIGILVVALALVCVGFFPEAFKARRLLEQALARTGA